VGDLLAGGDGHLPAAPGGAGVQDSAGGEAGVGSGDGRTDSCLLARLLGDSDALRVGDAVADLSRDVLALLARHNGATSSGTLLHLPALQEHGETR
jgi:hypothetical protein